MQRNPSSKRHQSQAKSHFSILSADRATSLRSDVNSKSLASNYSWEHCQAQFLFTISAMSRSFLANSKMSCLQPGGGGAEVQICKQGCQQNRG